MAESEIIKEYASGEITVVWKPRKCIHSGICVKTLPGVYNPKERPWIKPENASTKDLQKQIEQCPSGALSYKLNTAASGSKASKTSGDIKVEALANGPLLVYGRLEITLPDGSKEVKKRSTAFCRCGGSANKPYCDGSHNDSGFEG